MKQFVTLLFLFVAITYGYSQNISISSVDSSTSLCFNNGSITVNPAGGAPPYTYTIISGPIVTNVTYPIAGGTNNVFTDLHSGAYTVQVVDQANDTALVTITVPGNYQFPLASYSLNGDTIFAYHNFGKPPYQFALSTVGTNGPFGPYQSSNVFPNLCNGPYYLRVLDSCQNFYTTSVIYINNPSLALAAYCQNTGGGYNTVTVTAGFTGNAPYSFKLVNGSFTSTNTTGVFNVPVSYTCPDTMYASDYCHANAQTTMDCHPLSAVYCSNFTDSTGSVSVGGGTAPYKYTFYQLISGIWVPTLVQDSGSFSHLPYANLGETVGFGVVDACGRSIGSGGGGMTDMYMIFSYIAACPFNDTVLIWANGAFIPGTITCLTCPQAQTQSLSIFSSQPNVFVVPDTGTYTLRAVDACGETRDTTIHVPNQPIIGKVHYISCNGVQITASSVSGIAITTGVEYILTELNTTTHVWDTILQNTTGLFVHLATGSYQVLIIPSSCKPAMVSFYVPFFDGYCTVPYFDSSCSLKFIVHYGSQSNDYPENYSLKSSTGTIYNEDPQGGGNGIYFNIPPGNYTLISDSGCTLGQSFSFDFSISATYTHSCLDQSSVTLTPASLYFYYCTGVGEFTYTLQSADTILKATSIYGPSVIFPDVPPGTYLATAYFANDSVFMADTAVANGNGHCALDTLTVVIPAYATPIIRAKNVNVCGAHTLANIPFTITGGFPPYVVSILGQSTTTTDSSSGVLPNVKPDSTYTMEVSDSCGISSTYSVSVIDTCNIAICSFVRADFTVSDSEPCIGQAITIQNSFAGGTTYRWTANGILFDTTANPAYTANTAGSIVIKCVVTYTSLCTDSFSLTIQVDKPPVFNLGPDTIYCGAFTRILSSRVFDTHWSTGVTDSIITVSSPGTYQATVSNGCGNFSDSVTIGQNSLPVVQLPSDTTVCNGDSAVLNAFFAQATYHWNTGSTADTIMVYQSGEYVVTVSLQGCQTIDSTNFQAVTITQLLPNDTMFCSGNVIILKPGTGTGPVWQDGSHDSTYTVSDSGVYSVTVLTVCGLRTDSITVTEHITPAVNLGHDSILCNGDSMVLHAFFPNATYTWNTGSHADSIVAGLQGEYVVTVSSLGCKAVDSVYLQAVAINPELLIADTIVCAGTSIVLAPNTGTNPVWQDGSHSPTYTVTQSGVYSVTVLTPCGTYTDSVTITEQATPIVNLGHDSLLCNGDSIVLHAFFPNSTYTWNTGSHADSVIASSQGEYIVTVSAFGCATTDSVYFQTATVNPDLLPGDTILCLGTSIVLAPNTGSNPIWQDGSHSAAFTVIDSGMYTVTVSTLCGDFKDSVKIGVEICASNLHVADAFTPNGDGINDYFTVFGESIAEYEIKIFNRWGEKVYDSRDVTELNNIGKGWDGTYKGRMEDIATFSYLITAKGFDGKDYFKKGNLTLIR